jgi:hypothetical protein
MAFQLVEKVVDGQDQIGHADYDVPQMFSH